LSKSKVLAWGWVLVVGLLIVHNAYLWLGKQVVPDSDILALLPVQDRDPVLQQAFTHMVDSAQQRLIVLIGAENWDDASRAADVYRKVLAQHTDLFQFTDPVTDQAERDWLALFQQHRLILLTPQNEAALRGQPQQFWVETAMGKLYSPFGGFKLGAWRDDPFGLFGDWVQARARETPVRPRDGRLFVSDGRRQYAVMPITLRVPAFSMAGQQAVMPLLEQARQSAKTAVPQVEILTAGVILHAAAASEQARQEMSTIGIGSAIGILAMMWLSFHSLKPIALILLSIGIGCLGALSICWLLFDRIHLLTLVFGASLIGVAEDYAIYFLCNRVGADAQLDSRQLLRRLLPGLLLTLVTTLAVYASLLVTPLPVLRQMAVFSILGLVFAWLTVVLWFPTLVRAGSITRTPLAQRCGASLSRWPLLRRNRWTLAVTVLFIAMTVFGLSRLSANDDIRLLQSPPKNLLDDQIKISKLLDAPTPVQFYLVRGSTPEVVLQREEMLKQRLDPLIGKQAITGYQAISNWVPSLKAQAARRGLIEQKLLHESGPLKILALHLGEDVQWIGATRDHLLASGSALTPDDFLKTSASEPWRYLWLGQWNGGYASVVALRSLNYAGIPVLRDAALGLEGVQWVDKVEEISSVLGGYRKYMSWVVMASYLGVYALLYPRYRRAAWRLIVPTATASLFTLALLGMTGQKLQLFHVLALMLLLGIGVDYSIFLHERPTRARYTAWLAVGLSAASTLLSFGLLGLSKTPALQAFGLTLLIGIATAWLIVPCFSKERFLSDTGENFVADGAVARRRA
jgi:predicted exporter